MKRRIGVRLMIHATNRAWISTSISVTILDMVRVVVMIGKVEAVRLQLLTGLVNVLLRIAQRVFLVLGRTVVGIVHDNIRLLD